MEVRGGHLYCVEGEMSLSQAVEQGLRERFPSPAEVAVPRPSEIGDFPWFCPGCGALLGQDLACASCGVSIMKLRFQLVELYPHKGGPYGRRQ